MPFLCAVRLQGHLHVHEPSQEAAQAENLQPIYSDMLKQVTFSTQGFFGGFKSLLTPGMLQEYITRHC